MICERSFLEDEKENYARLQIFRRIHVSLHFAFWVAIASMLITSCNSLWWKEIRVTVNGNFTFHKCSMMSINEVAGLRISKGFQYDEASSRVYFDRVLPEGINEIYGGDITLLNPNEISLAFGGSRELTPSPEVEKRLDQILEQLKVRVEFNCR